MASIPESLLVPYVTASYFSSTLDLFGRLSPAQIDGNFLAINGIPQSMVFPLLSAIKFFGIIDDKGQVTDRKLLIRLGNPQERQGALKELVDKHYAELITSTAIEDATVNSINLYFQYHDVKPSISGKAARFFMWIAQAAGYKLGEEYKPQSPIKRTSPRKPANKTQEKQPVGKTSEKPPTQKAVETSEEDNEGDEDDLEISSYDEQILRLSLDIIRQKGELPDKDVFKELVNLSARVQRKRPPNTS
jgi:hypothetical protein